MRLGDVSISRQLRLGLGIILALVLTLGAVAWLQTDRLWRQTDNLYRHPFQVSRALGELENIFLLIRVDMRDLALGGGINPTSEVLPLIASRKNEAERQLTIVRNEYLGPIQDVNELTTEFARWTSYHEESARLYQDGKTAEAVYRITTGAGGQRIGQQLRARLDRMQEFARKKADEFYRQSEVVSNESSQELAILFGVIVLLSTAISWLFLKSIKDPIRDLTDVVAQFQRGRLAARSSYDAGNELGSLGRAFNAMAATIQDETRRHELATQIAAVMLRETELASFCRELLKVLLSGTGSQVGAAYFLNAAGTSFELFDSIGMGGAGREAFSATTLDGEVGAALATGVIQHLSDIPSDSRFTFAAASGDFVPRAILTIPVLAGAGAVAVISLASVRPYDEAVVRLVNDVWSVLTARLNGVLAARETEELARRLERQNRELDAQKHELMAQKSELNQQNIELEAQKAQLDQASRLKSAFLSNMSHELRTPLNSVIALSGVLHRRLEKTVSQEERGYLDVIQRNGKALLALINDILDLSRIEAGHDDVNPRSFSLHELVQSVNETLGPQARNKNIELTVSGDQLPPIYTDPDKCLRIIQNLVANAVKFTETGRVEVAIARVGDGVSVAVRDTGIGIAVDQIPFVFDEFRQADDGNSRRFGGTGLGLAIARKCALLLDGTLTVTSELGKGSVFTLWLPLGDRPSEAVSDADVERRFHKRAAVAAPAPRAQGQSILIVEDSEPAIVQLTDVLGRQGYLLSVARNGREALAMIGQSRPDAMILDLMMPEVDGFKVLKAIRGMEQTARLPVLILTAKHVTKDELSFLTSNNVQQLIHKGDVDREELLAAVARMVALQPLEDKSLTTAAPVAEITGRRRPDRPLVLIVDDHSDSRLAAKALLSAEYRILEAENGRAGIEMATAHRPDVILMDISMPVMDGVQALWELRKTSALRDIPVVAFTASAMTGDRESILAQGFNAYLSKPIDPDLLAQALNAVLG